MTKYITHATILVSLTIVQALNHIESNRRHLKYGLVNALKEAKAGYMERMDMHSRKE